MTIKQTGFDPRKSATCIVAIAFGMGLAAPAIAQELQVWKYGSPASEREYFSRINDGFPGGSVTWEPGD